MVIVVDVIVVDVMAFDKSSHKQLEIQRVWGDWSPRDCLECQMRRSSICGLVWSRLVLAVFDHHLVVIVVIVIVIVIVVIVVIGLIEKVWAFSVLTLLMLTMQVVVVVAVVDASVVDASVVVAVVCC